MREPQDQGTTFGTWDDPVSRLLYRDSVPFWIADLGVDTSRPTVDLGGANGLLRPHFPDLLTVDSDPTKEPDVVADVTLWGAPPGLECQAVVRYVLHYLEDRQVALLLSTVASYSERLYLVQFVNADLAAKRANSHHEGPRFFRSAEDLDALIDRSPWTVEGRWEREYRVTPEFYLNRLGPGSYSPHNETLVALALSRPPLDRHPIPRGASTP